MKREGTPPRGSNNGKDGHQNFAQLKVEVVDLKAEVERLSKKRKKGSAKKRYVRYGSRSDSK